jgi:3'-phosphoadenosine 5'-phosphosulfate sulfotransferase (PAPS reductase)/FAD synthetase
VSGLRRDQNPTRNDTPKIQIDHTHGGIVKLNPLADWTREQVADYVRAHNVPTNRLHAQNYPSVGCEPCTRAVRRAKIRARVAGGGRPPATASAGSTSAEEGQGSGI